MSAIAIGPRIVALLLGLAAPTPPVRLADLPAEAEVIVAALDVFDEPDDDIDRISAAPAGRPGHGPRRRATRLAGDRTASRLVLLDRAVLPRHRRPAGPGARGRPALLVRSGHPQAKIPGLPRVELTRGTVVRLLNRAPMTVGQGRDRRTWRAIAPPPGDVRHIHASGVRIDPARAQVGDEDRPRANATRRDPDRAMRRRRPSRRFPPTSPPRSPRSTPSTARSSAGRSSSGASMRSASVMRRCSRA